MRFGSTKEVGVWWWKKKDMPGRKRKLMEVGFGYI